MRKKIKQKKKKHKVLSRLSQEEEATLHSLLENLKHINPVDIGRKIDNPQIAETFVERLPSDDPKTVDLILAVGDAFDQKSVQKSIKKAIFRLKQKGVFIPERKSLKETPLLTGKPERDEPTAYLGPIDGMGSRGIIVILPQIPKGVNLGMGLVNDEEGITYFISGSYSKKRAREVKDIFLEHFSMAVEASLPHAATILERVYKCHKPTEDESRTQQHSAGNPSSNYLWIRPKILENISLLEQAAIYDHIPLDSISSEILVDSQINKLLEHDLMAFWVVDPEKMEPLLEEIFNAEDSPIFISEEQKASRINEIKDKAMDELYPDSKRLLLKERLEEMAYIFYRRDEEDYARLSLMAASSMQEKDSLLVTNPFLKALLDRSIDYYTELSEKGDMSQDEEEKSTPKIIMP